MGIVEYLRARVKPMLLGFLIGLVAGYARSHFFSPPDLPDGTRWALIFQIALAFSGIGLFLTNYFEFRQRVLKRVELENSKSD